MSTQADILAKIHRALGRTAPLATTPTPPAIDEPITRLVHSEIGLPELFASHAQANQFGVHALRPEELIASLIEFLRSNNCRRIALARAPILEYFQIEHHLTSAGFEVRSADQLAIDDLYEIDCSITDVYCAVAEVGALVVRESPGQGRALSLIPPIHLAILEPRNFVPDLVDLFEKMSYDPLPGGTVLIAGPSKTSDIEMTLVLGVHGPLKVQLFILQ